MIRLRLREVLNEHHITQKELAELTGIRPATISEICRGAKQGMNFRHAGKIASVLGIKDIRELIDYHPEKMGKTCISNVKGRKYGRDSSTN